MSVKKPNSLIHFIVTELIYAITKYSLFELNVQIQINYEARTVQYDKHSFRSVSDMIIEMSL